MLARALLEEGKYPEAAKEVESGLEMRRRLGPGYPDFDDGILAARLDAVSGKYGDAQRNLNDLLKQAVKTGAVRQQYRIRLALGEIEIKAGKTQQGRGRLAALERETTAKGYLLIAHKAAIARGVVPHSSDPTQHPASLCPNQDTDKPETERTLVKEKGPADALSAASDSSSLRPECG